MATGRCKACNRLFKFTPQPKGNDPTYCCVCPTGKMKTALRLLQARYTQTERESVEKVKDEGNGYAGAKEVWGILFRCA